MIYYLLIGITISFILEHTPTPKDYHIEIIDEDDIPDSFTIVERIIIILVWPLILLKLMINSF